MIPLGIGFTASGLVGSQIGDGNPQQAKRNALSIVVFDLTMVIPVAIFFWSSADFVSGIFTNDESII